jgi:hypothetical protein
MLRFLTFVRNDIFLFSTQSHYGERARVRGPVNAIDLNVT